MKKYVICENNHFRIYHIEGICPLCEKERLYKNALEAKLKCVKEIENLQKANRYLREYMYSND